MVVGGGGRVIQIDERSPVPIYQQVVNEVKRGILVGAFQPDQRLPSIRDLALGLKVNPNTIAKAFQELESMGVIYFRRGQGAYVSPRSEVDRMQEATREIQSRFGEILTIARGMNLSRSELFEIIERVVGPDMLPGGSKAGGKGVVASEQRSLNASTPEDLVPTPGAVEPGSSADPRAEKKEGRP
jgi:GntR family transcriptional regulator